MVEWGLNLAKPAWLWDFPEVRKKRDFEWSSLNFSENIVAIFAGMVGMHRLWRITFREKSSPCVTVVNVDTVDHRNVENKQTKGMLPHVWNSRISICSVSTKYVKRTLTISQKYLLNIKYVSIYLVKGALLYYSRDNFNIAFLHVIPVFAHHLFYAFLLLLCTIVHLILLMITLLWPEKCHFNEDFMHGH